MADQTTQQNLITAIANDLNVSIEDVKAVVYGEVPISGEKLRSPIMKALGEDGRGVFICAVWKGSPTPNAVQNMPEYDYFGQILEGLNLYLHKGGYKSQLLVSNVRLADYDYFEHIISRRPEVGIINVASNFSGHLKEACEHYQRPLVFLDYPAAEDPTHQYIITMNCKAIIEEVVAHLYQLGHRRIAFIQGPQIKQTAIDRYEGYRAGLASADIAFDEALVRTGNWHEPA
ncbi:MAG TPA: substrate-binding domain-containing protein, partial [Aggregatilineales bacterium]|nr:substrate-binding domain-containing protein [Aggregatilineales bacterium]